MTDLDQLREVGDLVSPPAFDSLVSSAQKRARRTRIVTATASFSFLAAATLGLALANSDGDGAIRPAHLPSLGPSSPTVVLPDGGLSILATPAGEESAPLDAGRYRVPLSDAVAFEVDLPKGTTSNGD